MSLLDRRRVIPLLYEVPDMTNAAFGMEHMVAGLGSNDERPLPGDVVIVLETCGMGMTVRRDSRCRATGEIRQNGLPQVVTDAEGRHGTLILANLRRCGLAKGTWVYVE